MTKSSRELEQLNWAYLIPPQVGVAACAEGGAGIGKTETTRCLADHTSRRFFAYELSRSQPEDLQGFPVVSSMTVGGVEYRYMEFIPDERLLRASLEPSLLLLDEITNVVAPKQAAALNIVQNPPPNCWMFMACNPIDIACDGQPLTTPFVNRIWYGDWEIDAEAQDEGFVNHLNYPPPVVPIVPDDYMDFHRKWGILIKDYLAYCPQHRHCCPSDPRQRSKPWASPRQWHNVSLCMSAADAVDANQRTRQRLVFGLLGDAVGTQFLKYIEQKKLPSVEILLDNPASFPVRGRYDISVALINLIVQHIKRNLENKDVVEQSIILQKYVASKNEELGHLLLSGLHIVAEEAVEEALLQA